MIGIAINRTWQQLLHPKFRSVFLTAVIAAAATLALLTFGLSYYWPETITVGWEWIDQLGDWLSSASFWVVVSIGSYILFPGVVTLVMGLMTDQIAGAVEEEYYPNSLATRKVPVGDIIISAAKLTFLMVAINLVALVPYIILLFLGGFGAILLFVAINGFLLGREYFEMVAVRHMDPREMARFRVEHSSKIFFAGAFIAAMFVVPFVNILAPIVGAAVMTHVFHHVRGDAVPRQHS